MSAEEASGHAIETLLLEQRRYRPSAEFAAQANAQPGIYRRGLEEFWREEGSSRVSWFESFDRLYEWEPLGDTTTVTDPAVVQELADRGRELATQGED
jgi:hypothetical protein